MGKVRVLAMLTALALLLTLPAVAYAQSLPPHIFVGHAMVDGDDARNGTVVTAMIGEEEKGTTTVMDGMYTLPVNAGAGTEVSFMVGDMSVMEKGSWMQGGATMMDLMAGSAMIGPGGQGMRPANRGLRALAVPPAPGAVTALMARLARTARLVLPAPLAPLAEPVWPAPPETPANPAPRAPPAPPAQPAQPDPPQATR